MSSPSYLHVVQQSYLIGSIEVVLNSDLIAKLLLSGCILFGGFGTLAGLTEIWTITCIAYERHRAISTPLTKAGRLSSFQVSFCLFQKATYLIEANF